jgi:hypothetical protein
MDMGIKALRLVHVPQQLSLTAITGFFVLFLFLFGKSIPLSLQPFLWVSGLIVAGNRPPPLIVLDECKLLN